MKKLKILSVITVIAIIFSINIFGTVNAEEELPCIFLSNANAGENELTEISVNFDKNVDISAFSIEILYNPENLSFIEAEKGSALNSGTFYYNNVSEDSVKLIWSNSRNNSLKGNCVKLTFKTKNASAGGSAPVYIGHSVLGNEDLEDVEFDTRDSEIKIYSNYLKGDVSGDGETDSTDIIVLNKYLLSRELYPIKEDLLINADIDYDGNINTKDSMGIINYVILKGWN